LSLFSFQDQTPLFFFTNGQFRPYDTLPVLASQVDKATPPLSFILCLTYKGMSAQFDRYDCNTALAQRASFAKQTLLWIYFVANHLPSSSSQQNVSVDFKNELFSAKIKG
jgi:hypothetical protein